MIRRLTLLSILFIWGFHLNAQVSYRVGFNSMYTRGDFRPQRDLVNGLELSANYRIKNLLYADAALGYGRMSGVDPQLRSGPEFGGGLLAEEFIGIGANRLHPNYINNYSYCDIGVSLKPSVSEGLLRFEIGVGLGFSIPLIKMDIKDENGDFYNAMTNFSQIENILNSMDGDYETNYKSGKTFLPHLYFQVGMAMDIGDNVYISLNIKSHFSGSDELDTLVYRTAQELTDNKDSVRSINVGFHYGLLSDGF